MGGSEQFKQDSATAADTSKLGKIEENPTSSTSTSSNQSPMTTIITLNSTNVNNNNAQRGNRKIEKSSTRGGTRGKKEEKPWYDASDEDVEIQTPDHITSIISVRGSSDEDPF